MFKETLVPIEALRSSIDRLGLGSPTTWAPERVNFNLRLVARDLGLPEEAPERPSQERLDQLLALAGIGKPPAPARFAAGQVDPAKIARYLAMIGIGTGKPATFADDPEARALQARVDKLLEMIPEGRMAIAMRERTKVK